MRGRVRHLSLALSLVHAVQPELEGRPQRRQQDRAVQVLVVFESLVRVLEHGGLQKVLGVVQLVHVGGGRRRRRRRLRRGLDRRVDGDGELVVRVVGVGRPLRRVAWNTETGSAQDGIPSMPSTTPHLNH